MPIMGHAAYNCSTISFNFLMGIVRIVWDISVSYLQCLQDKHVQGTMHIRDHAVFRNV